MSLRDATAEDIPRLVELGAMMHAESRYAGMRYNGGKVGMLLESIRTRGFLKVAVTDGEIVGAFAGVCEPHWFSDDLVATDLGLFVVPTMRGSMAAWQLTDAFVQWARERGAVITDILINTGVRPEQTARLFERLGGRAAGFVYSWGG